MDANIVDALIADFEHEDLFTHGSSGVEGLSGDAQRCMHLAGMLQPSQIAKYEGGIARTIQLDAPASEVQNDSDDDSDSNSLLGDDEQTVVWTEYSRDEDSRDEDGSISTDDEWVELDNNKSNNKSNTSSDNIKTEEDESKSNECNSESLLDGCCIS